MKQLTRHFKDLLPFDAVNKTVLSTRDGVSEYYGAELGIEPADKLFTVYRSPATTANAAMKMAGIPVTDGHVSMDTPPPANGGSVLASEMVDFRDEALLSSVAVKNQVSISDTLLAKVEAGQRQLSLAGGWKLVPHDSCDFEATDITPHHLAVIEQARQGPNMRFLDSQPKPKGNDMKKKFRDQLKAGKLAKAKFADSILAAFCDAEGEMNLQAVVEIATAIPEAIKTMSLEQLQQLMPVLQEAIEAAKAGGAKVEDEEPSEEDKKKLADEEAAKKEDDEKKFSDAVAKKATEFLDAAIAERDDVVEKARLFVDESYSFKGKETKQIMRDVLALDNPGVKFADSELSVAFKLLKPKRPDYSRFGDSVSGRLSSLKGKEF